MAAVPAYAPIAETVPEFFNTLFAKFLVALTEALPLNRKDYLIFLPY